MKTNKIFFTLTLALGLSSCCNSYQPTDEANLYEDDYTPFLNIKDIDKWGVYNVHDPSIRKFGDTYYCYSTDVYFGHPKDVFKDSDIKVGVGHIRSSKDLVNWKFEGFIFDSIPQEAKEFVKSQSPGFEANNIWAPFILKHGDVYRLYYSFSAFGKRTSYIGLAESESPLGPWQPKGCAVKTDTLSKMNAIDPSVVTDAENGKMWMIYGSFFGGIYALELNPQTGLALKEGDQGHMIAHRKNWQKDNMEAPEIIYNPELKKYFLFTSYGPLVTTYNVRACVADHPEGPYVDYFGNDPKDEIDYMPIVTAAYKFDNHPGWAGLAHCTVFDDGDGHYFMASQGRLSPQNFLMDLHVRRLDFQKNGFPTVSPERFTGFYNDELTKNMICGSWEFITLNADVERKDNDAGQVRDNHLIESEINSSCLKEISCGDVVSLMGEDLTIKVDNKVLEGKVYFGHDWENKKKTILFSALNENGNSIWAKKVK